MRVESIFWTLSLISIAIWSTDANVYPFGPEHGDTVIVWGDWSSGSTQLNLLTSIPFLGTGSISSVWINTLGAISYNEITDSRQRLLSQNIALAPLFVETQQGQNGSVHYRQVQSDDSLFDSISRHVSQSRAFSNVDFVPNYALIVTWENVAPVQNVTLQNTFQIVVASDGAHSYAIYNYNTFDWFESGSINPEAGIFVSGDVTESCDLYILGSANQNASGLLGSSLYSVNPGRHVLDITDPLKCTNFTGPCPTFPENERGVREFFFENTNDNIIGWNFYVVFSCKPTLSISPGVQSRTIQCLYDSDYYEYNWEETSFTCMDFSATRQFVSSVGVLRLNDPMIVFFSNGEPTEELAETIDDAVIRLFNNLGITGVFNEVYGIVNATDPDGRDGNTRVNVEVMTFITPSTNRKLTDVLLRDLIQASLINFTAGEPVVYEPSTVSVTDRSDPCLQSCLCRNRFDISQCRKGNGLIQPDACCGPCQGKPYPTSIKACCADRTVYDPKIAVCCNGRVIKGAYCP